MDRIMSLIVAGFVGWVAGLLCGACIKRLESSALYLGLAFGFFLGISASPVLGVALTAVVGLVGAALKTFQVKQTEKPENIGLASQNVLVECLPTETCRDFTQELGTRWVPALCKGLIVGALFGVTIRTNDLLTFPKSLLSELEQSGFSESQARAILQHRYASASGELPDLRKKYLSLGFKEEQVARIMERQASSILLDPLTLQSARTVKPETTKPIVETHNNPAEGSMVWNGRPLTDLASMLLTKLEDLPEDSNEVREVKPNLEAKAWIAMIQTASRRVKNSSTDAANTENNGNDDQTLSSLYHNYTTALLASSTNMSIKQASRLPLIKKIEAELKAELNKNTQ